MGALLVTAQALQLKQELAKPLPITEIIGTSRMMAPVCLIFLNLRQMDKGGIQNSPPDLSHFFHIQIGFRCQTSGVVFLRLRRLQAERRLQARMR
jgi:hypothetical protein